jgi:hypothetical protein
MMRLSPLYRLLQIHHVVSCWPVAAGHERRLWGSLLPGLGGEIWAVPGAPTRVLVLEQSGTALARRCPLQHGIKIDKLANYCVRLYFFVIPGPAR